MSKKVRTLLRVSSKQQLHEGDIPVQRAEAEQYIARQSDWVFDKEYIEKAVSAYKNSVEDREVLQKILADARAGEFNILLAYMSDRIGRQEEYSFYVAALNQLGIEVWTIKDGQLKTREHTDKLLNFIRFWQNEGESRKTSMRVKDARREMVKAGKFPGGRAPYGYKLVPSGMVNNHGRLLKKLEIVEKDAAVVKKIYDLAILKGMGYEKISRTLNDEGILSAAGSKWKPAAIAGILKNPIYILDMCLCVSVGCKVRLVLYDLEELYRILGVGVIIHTDGVQIKYLSAENLFGGANVTDAIQKLFPVVPAANPFEAFIVQRKSLSHVLFQDPACPNAELSATQRFHTVSDRNNDIEIIAVYLICLPISGSCCKICNN